MERLSLGTGMTAAMSQGRRLAGTVMWMPLAGRIACGSRPSSRARTSSAQTPEAFTTIRARTGNSDVASSATGPDDGAVDGAVRAGGQADDRGVVGHVRRRTRRPPCAPR